MSSAPTGPKNPRVRIVLGGDYLKFIFVARISAFDAATTRVTRRRLVAGKRNPTPGDKAQPEPRATVATPPAVTG